MPFSFTLSWPSLQQTFHPRQLLLQDVMLRNAGQESWESMELVPKRAGGRRSKKGRLKISKKLTPPRKRQQGKVTSQSVGDGGLYLVSGRAGVVQEGGPDSESRLAKHDVWQPEQATTPGETGEQVLKTTSSKLTGGLIAKLAVKIMRADGSIFVIRKSTATRSHAGWYPSDVHSCSLGI